MGRVANLTDLCFAAASLTVISVKAVSGMITESIKGQLQLIYPIFYIMLVVMIASCAFQIKSVNVSLGFFVLIVFFFSNFHCVSLLLNSLLLTTNLNKFFAVLVPRRNEGKKKKKNIQNCRGTVSVLHLHTFSKPRTFHLWTLSDFIFFLLCSQISQSGDENV